jgi:hypothetical protein
MAKPPSNLNRDDDLKPGRPPRNAQEPKGSEGSSRSPKTMTDPASGAPTNRKPAPNQAKASDRK